MTLSTLALPAVATCESHCDALHTASYAENSDPRSAGNSKCVAHLTKVLGGDGAQGQDRSALPGADHFKT